MMVLQSSPLNRLTSLQAHWVYQAWDLECLTSADGYRVGSEEDLVTFNPQWSIFFHISPVFIQ